MSHQHDGDRRQALVDLIQARCWAAGYVAPGIWVEWLLDLQLDKFATDEGVTVEHAAHLIPVDMVSDLADGLIKTTKGFSD